MPVFAEDIRGYITQKCVSQLHIHFTDKNMAIHWLSSQTALPARIKIIPYVVPNAISPDLQKSSLTTRTELFQAGLEAGAWHRLTDQIQSAF